MHNPDSEIIAKPSEVLCSVRSMMDILQTLENYIHIDISRIFNNVLLQQTQATDGFTGEPTITQVCRRTAPGSIKPRSLQPLFRAKLD